ncbi:MAG TPA: hypothetical protein PLW48_09030 [Alphaproteobacteria bacterium]|nr:hypothetical protein [Rhodospirillaceae bacterium]HRJ67266.1 hypothetical protein [Alphaproteobacteria bacterium]
MNALFPSIPEWLSYLVAGLTIFAMLCAGAVIAARAGRNPYWALLIIVPFLAPVMVWAFAYARWPSMEQKPAASPPTT